MHFMHSLTSMKGLCDRAKGMLTEGSIVNNFLFAHQTSLLTDTGKAAKLRHNSNELLRGINVNKHFPWFPDFLESLPLSISKPVMPPGLIDMLELFEVSSYVKFTTKYSKRKIAESAYRAGQHHEIQIIRKIPITAFERRR